MEKLKLPLTTFMKLCIGSPRAKISVLKQYLKPGGYDFHKAMKRIAAKLISGQITLAQAEGEIEKIKQEPERRLTHEAILTLDQWRKTVDAEWKAPPLGSFKSKSGLITIKLEPEIAFKQADQPTSVLCLWNLVKPDLKADTAGEGIFLLKQELGNAQNQFGVLNLRTGKILDETLIKPTSSAKLERDLMVIEALWTDVQDEKMSTDDMLSHIATLKFPPAPSPPPM